MLNRQNSLGALEVRLSHGAGARLWAGGNTHTSSAPSTLCFLLLCGGVCVRGVRLLCHRAKGPQHPTHTGPAEGCWFLTEQSLIIIKESYRALLALPFGQDEAQERAQVNYGGMVKWFMVWGSKFFVAQCRN